MSDKNKEYKVYTAGPVGPNEIKESNEEKLGDIIRSAAFASTVASTILAGATGTSTYSQYFDEAFDLTTSKKIGVIYGEIEKLRKEVDEKAVELKKSKVEENTKTKIIKELERKIDELTEKTELSFLLARVNERAKNYLIRSDEFRKQFLDKKEYNVYVMSVDIRRSTELMLKACTHLQFANFISTLCGDLEKIVKDHYGVFDKFTGDGILAFFPDFYSGDDAGYYVISAADKSHKIFHKRYKEFRSSFTSILNNIGLGIGIDYGIAHMVQMAGGLTVVGIPVVYACRLSGAHAGTTLLNQAAYDKISQKFSKYCFLQESELEIKNEGPILAYEVKLNSKEFIAKQPGWIDQYNIDIV